ncbi:hypothetical protein BZG36_03656 [Bifiguratus adelaidae]|uniref:Aminopeptidase P N-terminal domain-containing protein n=1 Tax=Bifiguratus adelaidae TaxID=1938954 RepID=A0A261XW55_9FUNG|nr:hypothetical protein BZG36_03656 [Bifiguratus adelaidae]
MAVPAKQHALKVADQLGSEGVFYLKGQVFAERDDTDYELPFRQESNFFYVTGVNEPDFHFVFDLNHRKSILFAPPVNQDAVIWMGLPPTLEELVQKYDVDEAYYSDQLESQLEKLSPSVIHVFDVYDLSKSFPAAWRSNLVYEKLRTALAEARVFKTEWEIEALRKINIISSEAHIELMKSIRPGMTEGELYALFQYHAARKGAFNQSYLPIMACGMNAATLHYNRNSDVLDAADPHQMFLVDAGAELNCYASDITRTYPSGGKFSPEAKTIYEIVLAMQEASFALIKPGVEWEDVHLKAMHVAAEGLAKCGILKGTPQELVDNHIVAGFFPHGLGHLMGIDVHDVGGFPGGKQRLTAPGLKNLRLRRQLQPNMVVTVEPGIYFCDFIISPLLQDPATAKFVDQEQLARYRKVGGVRIEDDIVITETGFDNLTRVPKTVADIEAVMAPGRV